MEAELGINDGVQERALPLEPAGDGKTLSGYFATWHERATVDGKFIEQFAPGSMDAAIASGRMKVLYDHGQDAQIGRKPIGSIRSVQDDGTGAKYEVELLDAPYVEALMPGLRAGLYGASFRFRAQEQKVNRRPGKSAHNPAGLPEVTVTRADVVEFGPTPMPVYAGATASVRSIDVTPKPQTEAVPPRKTHQPTYTTREWFLK